MRLLAAFLASLALSSTVRALLPPTELIAAIDGRDALALDVREPVAGAFDTSEELWKRKGRGSRGSRKGWKRKGGGSSGGRGGGGSSSGRPSFVPSRPNVPSNPPSGSSGGSSGSSGINPLLLGAAGGAVGGLWGASHSSGGHRGSSSGGSSSGGSRGSGSSSTGGRTTGGSGVTPNYGRGSFYGGGTTVPYQSGSRSTGGVSPILLGGALGFGLAGLWHYNVYSYPYVRPWYYHNSTTNANETKPVNCLCEEFSECGCDENDDVQYQADVLGNGSYAALNKTLASVADVNGTSTIILNGTLPNGTTATGGTEAANSAGFSVSQTVMQAGGYWVLAALVGSAVFMA